MNQTVLTVKQSELLENLIGKHGQIVTFDQIFREAEGSWDYKQTKNLITKLVKNGWLVRIKRGLYAISDLSSRGFLSQSPCVIANLLVPDSYVSFETALQQHGMFDQLTGKTISISLVQHKTVHLGNMEYSFIHTQPKYYFGWQEVSTGNQMTRIASPEKALVDMVNFHKSQYAIDLVIEKLAEYRNELDLAQLTDTICRFPITTVKIFGFIFDLLGIDSSGLLRLIKPGSTHWMLPGDTKFNARWRLYYRADFDQYKAQ
jgi:predicted transcriptional regulator of viral defense system